MSFIPGHPACSRRRHLPTIVFFVAMTGAGVFGGCSAGRETVTEHPLITQGKMLYYTAQYERAERHFAETMITADSLGDGVMKAQCLKWLGVLQFAFKQNTLALARYRESLALLDSLVRIHADSMKPPPDRVLDERANVMNNVAVLHKEAGEYDKAEAIFRDVLSYDLERGADLSAAVSLGNIGILYNLRGIAADQKGDSAIAVEHFLAARGYLLQSLQREETAEAFLNLGNNHAYRDRLDSAVASYRKAEKLYADQGFRASQALCLGNIGILLAMQGDERNATRALRQCIALVEELRGDLTSIDVRTSFISNKFYLYENIISLLVGQGELDEAFEYVERAKARSLLDLIGNKAIGEEKKRSADVARLVDREQALQARISVLLEIPDSSRQLVRLLENHQDVLDELRTKDPEYASVKSIEPVKLRELQAMLDDSTALVEYFLGEAASFVFVVRRDSLFARRLDVPARFGLNRRIEQLRRMLYADFPNRKIGTIREARLQKHLSVEEAKAEWYKTITDPKWQYELVIFHTVLFAPLESHLHGIRQLLIVPHGPLHHLPFQALVRREGIDRRTGLHVVKPRYLIEDYAMGYLPSASVLRFARLKTPVSTDSALVVGDPLYADPVYRRKPLQGALVEADTVSHYIRTPVKLVRERADEATVKRSITAQGIVHLATHGELNKKEPLNSRILLAAGDSAPREDGNLTVAEVFNLDLRSSLVTLSACQTAQVAGEEGKFTPGDDLVGLSRSFMYAGTPSVIASLWYVDDAATLAWMRHFYASWLQAGLSKMQSARQAALRMLASPEDPDWVFPYYWSAFIYFGDSRD